MKRAFDLLLKRLIRYYVAGFPRSAALKEQLAFACASG